MQAQCLADPECSLEQAREKLLNEMGRESTPSNKNTPAHIYAGNGNFVGDGIRQALMARAGFEKTERDNVYNGMTLREYARMSLTERGIGVSSYNPMQMVGAAFTHSTSDFGNILLDVANKAILQGWEDAPETYEQWTRKGQLSDFKIAHRVGIGGFSALRQVREGAEYKYVTTGDKQATIALATYGELFSITRQAIINDDLNMLTDVPMKLGRAAKSTIADLVYAILTSNPKISTDNVSLFDKAKHANVLESAAMDVASLDKARQLMRVQREGERHLNIRPAFVLVPTAMESVANQVIRSSSVKGADINAGIINPVKDFATVIAEPRLDDNSQTTFCLAAAKAMKMNPRQVAQTLIDHTTLTDSYFTSVEIAGPGFMNFRLGGKWFADTVSGIETAGEKYGENDTLAGRKYMVEFVSANPTGPMHMGNARGGVLGDTLASVLQKSGADVWREFYVNDAGNQIEKFAKSLEARYFQIIKGEDAVEFPEDGYHGDDIRELAQAFYENEGDKYLDCDEKTRHDALAQFGLSVNIPKMKADLARYGIQYDQWFFESSLHDSGYVADTVQALTDRDYTYEKDGALWLKTSDILAAQLRQEGKSDEAIEKLGLKDDVLRRANGFYTYFAADIAYHRNKFAVRGFDKVINIWGADHHGHVARLKGAMDALGLDGQHRLDIVLMQLVKLVRDGETVRMSKRTGKAISLTDLLDEIPVDACRWFFNAKPETQMEFDLGLAVREDSENPVYYVQYAYARICTLVKALAAEGYTVPAAAEADLSVLTADEEKALIKQLAQYPAVVQLAARDYDPSFINRYLVELAAAFHKFYNACRIKGEAENVLLARLKLADTARAVLKNGMTLIGCSAPEKM